MNNAKFNLAKAALLGAWILILMSEGNISVKNLKLSFPAITIEADGVLFTHTRESAPIVIHPDIHIGECRYFAVPVEHGRQETGRGWRDQAAPPQ